MSKRVPHFWWDFRYDPDAVIVESDDPRVPVVKSWPDHSPRAIEAAQALLVALRQGRVDYRRADKRK